MAAKIISGTDLSKKIRIDLKSQVEELKKKNINPGLAVILVGNDESSKIYVGKKKKACEELGIQSFEYLLDDKTSEEELLALIKKLNSDKNVNGILVQSPIPGHLDMEKVMLEIDPAKDVDGLHPINIGRLLSGDPLFLPCTPAGIMEMIKESGTDVEGKECVVVGRSNIVGKPQAMLMLVNNATVTICHSKTKNLEEICRRADILVVAIGKREFIKGSYIKPGAVVIDVGINRLENGKVIGDVEFSSVSEIASVITPVPKGVGPMTITMLMKNTINAAKLQNHS